MNTKLPTWKQYYALHPELRDVEEHHFQVRRILYPARYPSWGFVTDEFRLSVEMPAEFRAALTLHSNRRTAVIFTVAVRKGRPIVGCRIYTGKPEEAGLPWCAISCFDTWAALDDESSAMYRNADDKNSAPHEPTIDNASINMFVAKQKSLGRHKESARARKTGES